MSDSVTTLAAIDKIAHKLQLAPHLDRITIVISNPEDDLNYWVWHEERSVTEQQVVIFAAFEISDGEALYGTRQPLSEDIAVDRLHALMNNPAVPGTVTLTVFHWWVRLVLGCTLE